MLRLMWREAKKNRKNYLHVRAHLTGLKDYAECNLCERKFDLEIPDRTRESVLLEITRKHYYKHKLDLRILCADCENPTNSGEIYCESCREKK